MRRFCIFLVAAIAACATPSSPAGLTVKKPTKLQQLARGIVKAGSPGAIVFVRTPKGTRSAVAGYASLTPRLTMRAADRFRIASVTKTFVATVVLELAAEGKLGLDDTVERWLPGKIPNGSAITLRQLLSHTSGIFNYTDDEPFINGIIANPARAWTPQELLGVAFSHPPLFAPGANWSYSNTNYIVLGLVVEAVTGKPIADVLRERIFEPLKLRSTSFPIVAAESEPFVHGFIDLGTGLIDITSALNPTLAYAAGEIVSNADDVTTFYAKLLRGGLISPPFLAQMKAGAPNSGTYGLGIDRTTTKCGRAFGHDGDFFGWRNITLSTADGKRQAVVVVNVNTRVSWARMESAVTTALCSG